MLQERQVAFYFFVNKTCTAVALLHMGVHCGFTVAGSSSAAPCVKPVSLLNKMSDRKAHHLNVQTRSVGLLRDNPAKLVRAFRVTLNEGSGAYHCCGYDYHNLFPLEEPAVEGRPRLAPMHTLRPRCIFGVSCPVGEGRLRRLRDGITGRGLYRSED